eukprot:2481824-Pyramimonas_sp.AAC.1
MAIHELEQIRVVRDYAAGVEHTVLDCQRWRRLSSAVFGVAVHIEVGVVSEVFGAPLSAQAILHARAIRTERPTWPVHHVTVHQIVQAL